jgi:hypothetical protein
LFLCAWNGHRPVYVLPDLRSFTVCEINSTMSMRDLMSSMTGIGLVVRIACCVKHAPNGTRTTPYAAHLSAGNSCFKSLCATTRAENKKRSRRCARLQSPSTCLVRSIRARCPPRAPSGGIIDSRGVSLQGGVNGYKADKRIESSAQSVSAYPLLIR